MELFMNKFGFDFSSRYISYFDEAKKRLAESGTDIFDFEKHDIYTYMKSDIARIRDELITDKDNALYCYFLSSVLATGDPELYNNVCAPHRGKENELFDTLPLFALLDLVPGMVDALRKKGIPEDVIESTLGMFENQVQDFLDVHGHYGISDYVGWMMAFIQCRIIRIGRLNFEYVNKCNTNCEVFSDGDKLCVMPYDIKFHRSGQVLGSADCDDEEGSFGSVITETDEYFEGIKIENGIALNEKIRLSKDKWHRVYKDDGGVLISVHIPSGGPMTPQDCDIAIDRAKEIFDRCYGGFDLFYCCSWLLCPTIRELTGRDTNITRFGDRYTRYPVCSKGQDIYSCVWNLPGPVEISALEVKSSLAGLIKEHLMAGGHIYESRGFFKI